MLLPTDTTESASVVPRAVILGCAGLRLEAAERKFFRDANPLGFILFARNCESPAQLSQLVVDLRASVGRADAPMLIDQEGGRVIRMRPPHWRAPPAAGVIGAIAERDPGTARGAAWLNARLIAAELDAVGINICCLPVLDLQFNGASIVVGDRAFSGDMDVVADLGRATCAGLLAGGVLPVIKHIPGHGRATSDSHIELPRVEAPLAELATQDFRPFEALNDMPIGISAHVCYSDIDVDLPATQSAKVIAEIIRGAIGFKGLLLSDDLSMEALSGSLGERAGTALAAGCDVGLHCNGKLDEMADVIASVGSLSADAIRRWGDSKKLIKKDKINKFSELTDVFNNIIEAFDHN